MLSQETERKRLSRNSFAVGCGKKRRREMGDRVIKRSKRKPRLDEREIERTFQGGIGRSSVDFVGLECVASGIERAWVAFYSNAQVSWWEKRERA